MKTKYITSSDSAQIAYSVSGCGPALLLIHGSGYDKSIFLNSGWVERLNTHFTVITPDTRGFGESTKSKNPDFYSIQNILTDFNLIAEECGFKQYYYFGHSYGATIGLQACKINDNIIKAVCAGSYFGDDFFKISVPEWIKEYENADNAKKDNRLSELNLSAAEIEWVQNTDLEIYLAQFEAWNKWQGIDPKDIRTTLAVYSGTKDYEHILEHLNQQKDEMLKHNISLKIFEGLNHNQLVSNADIVIPWIIEFFQS